MSAPIPAAKRDPEALKRAARRALDDLTGPERVETLRHYGGSAKKAMAANAPNRGYDQHALAPSRRPGKGSP